MLERRRDQSDVVNLLNGISHSQLKRRALVAQHAACPAGVTGVHSAPH